MINNTRDIERFRQIAKLWVKYCKPTYPKITIDKFDYSNDEIVYNLRYKNVNEKFRCTLDTMLSMLQFKGIYKNYSIDRTTRICTTPMERMVVRTTVDMEV